MSILNSLNRRQFLKSSALTLGSAGLFALAGCSQPTQSTEASSDSAASDASSVLTGDFIVGFDDAFPPYGYVADDGSYTGFDLDLAQLVCDMNGWTYQPSPISWDAKDALLNSGQITCIWNGFTVEGRENDYTFTESYMENRQVMVVRADSNISSLADLAGKNVITQADSAALDLLSEDGSQAELGKTFGELQTIAEYNTAFMMLKSGSVDAVAVDYPVAVFNIGDDSSLTILDEALNSEHFAVGFAKDDQGAQLADIVTKSLQQLDADGKVKELCEKYASQGVSYDLWVLPKA